MFKQTPPHWVGRAITSVRFCVEITPQRNDDNIYLAEIQNMRHFLFDFSRRFIAAATSARQRPISRVLEFNHCSSLLSMPKLFNERCCIWLKPRLFPVWQLIPLRQTFPRKRSSLFYVARIQSAARWWSLWWRAASAEKRKNHCDTGAVHWTQNGIVDMTHHTSTLLLSATSTPYTHNHFRRFFSVFFWHLRSNGRGICVYFSVERVRNHNTYYNAEFT